MARKGLAALIVAGFVLVAGSPNAGAADSTVTLTLVDGTRTLTSAPAVALTGDRTAGFTGAYTATVTEVAKNGSNPVTVTAVLGDLTAGGGITGTIAGSNGVLQSRVGTVNHTIPVAAGTSSDETGFGSDSGALNAAQTVLKIDGEDTNTAYTGVHTGTGNLKVSIPDGTPAAAYSGTLTFTMIP